MAARVKTPPTSTSTDRATAYARAVASGAVVAGPHVRAACRRHLEDLTKGPERGLRWDAAESERVIQFFVDVLTVEVEETDDSGEMRSLAKPFLLQPWQCFGIGSLFGWKRQDGLRRFRRAYFEVGKGNGKSPMAAGVGHYMLGALKKLRAEVYSAATDKDQAAILFRDAVAMWERSKALTGRLTPSGVNPVWQLTHLPSLSFFKPISSEKKGKSGIRPFCALIDEVHEHPDNSVIEMLRAGTKGNQEALIFEITNSGFDRKSVCWSEHEYSVRVANGDLENDAWFSFVCGLDEGDEPLEDESCWIKANPNLGVSIHLPFIREQVAEAKGMPSKEGIVRRLHFCEWTESDSAAFPRALWTAAQGEVDADALTAKGLPCFGGLDLSRSQDLTAFTLTWILDDTKDKWKFASKTWFWTPQKTLADRARRDRAPYVQWVKEGWLEAVPGPRVSYKWVADALASICARHHPKSIGCDQYGLENLQDHLNELDAELPCVVHPQGFQRRKIGEREKDDGAGVEDICLWMPDSINKLEAALLETRIVVAPNPVMSMCATSVVYERNRTDHRMFAKNKATQRIDGMVSLAMSIGVATVDGSKKPKSYQMLFV